jgi:pimeloyl-ACP methyl ester carboxylesterase
MGKLFATEDYQQIILRDGRRLGYLDCGDPTGRPLFYFHAFRFCKIGRLPHQTATRLGIRLIAPDRPGFGLSDFQPGRTLLDWASDVAELANALRIREFSVAGHSGGSPYAAVCAHQLPGRVRKAAMFSGVGWYDVPCQIKSAVGRLPLSYHFSRIAAAWAARIYLKLSGHLGRTSLVLSLAGSPGTVLMPAPLGFTQLVSDFGDSASRERRFGAAWEVVLYSRPWGFRLEDIKTEMHVWHGEADRMIPAPLIRAMANLMPNCRARFLPGEDHFSLVPKYMAEMLNAVVS